MDKPSCFVIMPITTPEQYAKILSGGEQHFQHVYDHLFIPAIEKAGFSPIPPKMPGGSDMIQPTIIKKLSDSDLVLCDLSILNPNVFFELGIRTALNKPVCIVRDEHTRQMPFDIGDLNCHSYSSLLAKWETDEIEKLADHIKKTAHSKENQLWKIYGIAAGASSLPKPNEADKLGYIISLLEAIRDSQNQPSIFSARSLGGYQGLIDPRSVTDYGSSGHTSIGAQGPQDFSPHIYSPGFSGAPIHSHTLGGSKGLNPTPRDESEPQKKRDPKV